MSYKYNLYAGIRVVNSFDTLKEEKKAKINYIKTTILVIIQRVKVVG